MVIIINNNKYLQQFNMKHELRSNSSNDARNRITSFQFIHLFLIIAFKISSNNHCDCLNDCSLYIPPQMVEYKGLLYLYTERSAKLHATSNFFLMELPVNQFYQPTRLSQ